MKYLCAFHTDIKPQVVVFGPDYHRHPVVIRGEQFVRPGREKRAGLKRTAFAIPALPQARYGEGLAVLHVEVEGPLTVAPARPLEEPVRRDDAPAARGRPAEWGLLRDGLEAPVNEPVADGRVLSPLGHEPPLEERSFTPAGC